MKIVLGITLFALAQAASAQAWKTLPKGVRIFGYRNVTTSKISSNFNQFRSESALGAQFRVDGMSLNEMTGGMVKPTIGNEEAFNNLLVGEYKVDATAEAKVHGFGFGYGLTDKVMYYGEFTFYNTRVNSAIKRTKGNTFKEVEKILEKEGSSLATFARNMVDVNEGTIQSVITNYYGYKPIGTWYGSGYGDMETGLMIRAIDKGTTGLLLYPGVVLPTGRQDDPDLLQDMGYGDGQFDVFGEMATGYVYNDHLSFGSTFRYTYQAPTTKELRVPSSRDFLLSPDKGQFDVKYGDRFNFMANMTVNFNDWFSMTPVYRFMYQMPSEYDSKFGEANDYLAYNSDKLEHQVQLTTSISSIQPFLKKQFVLPAQINMNIVQTVSGKNVPKVGRFELELRMLF